MRSERGCSSVVERLLAKEKVVGSNPIARSGRVSGMTAVSPRFCLATSPSGKAGVCKTPIAGSIPAVAF